MCRCSGKSPGDLEMLSVICGDSFDTCKFCVDRGYTSVMIEASSEPFEENVAITRQVEAFVA